MKKQFLVGNFLRAYSNAYRYPSRYANPLRSIDTAWLEERFQDRTSRVQKRKRSYLMGVQVALAMALGVSIVATTIDLRGDSDFAITVAEQETVEMQEITQTVQPVLPPAPPRPPIPIVVPDDEELVEAELDLDATLDLNASIAALPPPPTPVVEDEEEEPEIFMIVEDMPEMIGGAARLAKAVQYPSIAIQAGIEGTVIVKIVVTNEGKPESPEILRSPSQVLDKAAVTAVMQQQFKPGRQRGKPVATYMAIPVRFRLTSNAL